MDTNGLACFNNLQSGMCHDYEVRFCCAETEPGEVERGKYYFYIICEIFIAV